MRQNKRQTRSCFSYKMVQNQEVILVSEAIDMLRQNGYVVIAPQRMQYMILCCVWMLTMSSWGLI